MTDPMTPADLNVLAEMRAEHQPMEVTNYRPAYTACKSCEIGDHDPMPWPCDAGKLLAAVDAVVAQCEHQLAQTEDINSSSPLEARYSVAYAVLMTLEHALTDAIGGAE